MPQELGQSANAHCFEVIMKEIEHNYYVRMHEDMFQE